MDDPIDLRPYLFALQRRRRRIALITLLAAIITLAGGLLLPPTYAATALVVVREPNQVLQFDPRFETAAQEPATAAIFAELALSDDVLTALRGGAGGALDGVESLDDLRRQVTATPAGDTGLLRLAVHDRDPGRAAAAANEWADLVVAAANDLLDIRDTSQLAFYDEQLAAAAAALSAAEQALIDYQGLNRSPIINNEIAELQGRQQAYLADRERLRRLHQDIGGLLTQIENGGAAQPGEQLAAFLLQVRTYNANAILPLELQLTDVDAFTTQSAADQAAALDGLLAILDAQQATITRLLADLEPELLARQQSFQAAAITLSRLERERHLAEETYIALARKVEQERISTQDTSSGMRLVSGAAAPDRPVSPNLLLLVPLGTLLGLSAALLATVAPVWWRQETAAP